MCHLKYPRGALNFIDLITENTLPSMNEFFIQRQNFGDRPYDGIALGKIC